MANDTMLPYSADSFYKSKTAGAPVDSARTTTFRNFMKSFPDQKGTPYPLCNGLGSNKWGTPFAFGTSSDPIWKLAGTVNPKAGILKTQGFHAPSWFGDMITGTSDSPFCVIDSGFGYTVFGTRAQKTSSNTISIGGGTGLTYHSSNGLDAKNPKSNDKRNLTSRGRISDAQVIRRAVLDQAIANNTGLGHVLHLFMCETKSSDGYCHPMVGCESSKNGFGAEGERIAIAPNVDLTKRGLSAPALAIARTLQQNGAYIGDNAGGATALKMEQTSNTRNPWKGLTVDQKMLKGITWDDFVVIKKGWQ